MIQDVEIRHFHLFAGLGGGARGFNRGHARVGNLRAKFRCLGGIDVDPAAVRDFSRLAGVPGTCLDLFERAQYTAFHGHEPPADWREATPSDIRKAAGDARPHIVFLSAPCKGFSGLLSEAQSKGLRYQALNRLTLRGIWLMLEAWGNDPTELVVFENVPRILVRGRTLLDQIGSLLRHHGYAVAETTHDCGEIGGLAQSRKRFLLVARHMAKVPPFLYEPAHHKLRGVGEVLDNLPLPLSGIGGPMHRMPALQWKTWVRLAFVEAGSDWRSLNRLAIEDGVLRDFGIAPEVDWRVGALGVQRWGDPSATVTSRGGPTNGRFAVADPRAGNLASADRQNYAVGGYDEPAATITSARSPGQGRFAVADPRVDGHKNSVQLGIKGWQDPAATVTGQSFPGQGRHSVADPRVSGTPYSHVYRIVPWAAHAPAVTSANGGSGAAVADPRAQGWGGKGKYQVARFDGPANAVIAASSTGHGASAMADPRTGYGPNSHRNKLAVVDWEKRAGTITGSDCVGSGALSVADPRGMGPETHKHVMRVTPWDGPSGTVTSAHSPSNGTISVADPRPDFARGGRTQYETGGHYGVIPYDAPAGAVTAAGQHDNGRWSVADPRGLQDCANPQTEELCLPAANDRLVCVIRALDGTWHRPFTTLELAALQSLVDPEDYLELDGLSDSAWRERIGNCVPPAAGAAIASVMGRTLLMAWSGQSFMLSSESIWVRPIALALSVDPSMQSEIVRADGGA